MTGRQQEPWPLGRRRFLGLAAGVTAAGLAPAGLLIGRSEPVGASRLSAADMAVLTPPASFGRPGDRTLIVIELEGGNDALNTLVPATGRYHDLRPTIGLGDDQLLTFAGLDYGVHPALAPLEPLWDAGRMAAFYGIGMTGQTRSHFVAQDAWRSAGLEANPTSGWLGRWLEATRSPDPNPLRAISLGAPTLAAQGQSGGAVAVQSVETYDLRPPEGNPAVVAALAAMGAGADPGSDPARGLNDRVRSSLSATVDSVAELQSIIAAAVTDRAGASPGFSGSVGSAGSSGPAAGYVDDPTSDLFRAAGAIVSAEVGTQVLYITLPGYDTHAGQLPRHEALLGQLGQGLGELFAGLADTGHTDRVMVMVVSEFGRRAAENGSLGTDHGSGGLGLLLGSGLDRSQVLGGVDLGELRDGDLAMTIDPRRVYATGLGWLGGSAGTVSDDWPPLEILAASIGR